MNQLSFSKYYLLILGCNPESMDKEYDIIKKQIGHESLAFEFHYDGHFTDDFYRILIG